MKRGRRIFIHALGVLAGAVALGTLPIAWCGRGAEAWMEGARETQLRLSRGVARLVLDQPVARSTFHTGSAQFNGEWLFGSYLMAGIGFSQMALEHPEIRETQARYARRCIERLLSPEVRAFDHESWNEDPLDGIDGPHPHAAYLGYANFLLGLYEWASGDATYAALHDRITAALVRHLSASKIGLLESYPQEVYPIDNCFVIGSIGLHQRVRGEDHSATIRAWASRVRSHYLDPETHLLVQAVSAWSGEPGDAPRGSGTALGLLPLHYADPELARELYRGIKDHLAGTWLGFGAVREYPKGGSNAMDIDSGPIVFGYGLSATGFSLAGARRYGDAAYFKRLFATARLCGAPREDGGRREYVSGGALGNAILFAMLTVPREEVPPPGGSR